jgi:hypothetical protein
MKKFMHMYLWEGLEDPDDLDSPDEREINWYESDKMEEEYDFDHRGCSTLLDCFPFELLPEQFFQSLDKAMQEEGLAQLEVPYTSSNRVYNDSTARFEVEVNISNYEDEPIYDLSQDDDLLFMIKATYGPITGVGLCLTVDDFIHFQERPTADGITRLREFLQACRMLDRLVRPLEYPPKEGEISTRGESVYKHPDIDKLLKSVN